MLKTQTGPFAERPFFGDGEIDQICGDELQRVGLLPSSPMPIRIDRFIEKRFGLDPEYEETPDGVLGYSRFGAEGIKTIVVSKALAEEGSTISERRVNTTLAHEAAHGLLHAHLFALEPPSHSPRLIEEDVDRGRQRILCRSGAIQGVQDSELRPGYDGRWWEFQANQGIGALLMPRALVNEAVGPFLSASGALQVPILELGRRGEAVARLIDIFDVNPSVARIRLDEVFPPTKAGQLTL